MPTARPLRNCAVIAHVDHGKTTLVDEMLKAANVSLNVAGSGAVGQQERVMDSHDIEKERGITILSKTTSFLWGPPGDDGQLRFNIVDTPGHSDFGGEVERVLSMVDGALLLVDATEGPMAQTKFVLSKALRRGLRPVVVFNKVDRQSARLGEVENEVFDLFASMDADDDQLDFAMCYASAKHGWATLEPPESSADLARLGEEGSLVPLLQLLAERVPPPSALMQSADDDAEEAPFQMLVTTIDRDQFVGRLVQGRVASGSVAVGDSVHVLSRTGEVRETGRVVKLFARNGLTTVTPTTATTGDIVQLAGLPSAGPTDTVAATSVGAPLPADPIDEPTISMTFGVNDSPLGGKVGKLLTSAQIAQRLEREAETNVSLRVVPASSQDGMPDAMEVRGRGELQLSVLIEEMRREGFELSVSPPRVVLRETEDGRLQEPFEDVMLDVEEEHTGTVIDAMNQRKGQMHEYSAQGDRAKLTFRAPSRGLIGFQSELKTMTRGSGLMYRTFAGYDDYERALSNSTHGSLVSSAQGVATAYALAGLEPRGVLFVAPQEPVYEGMVIGEHAKGTDLDVNPTKEKKLTNVRAAGTDDAIRLAPPLRRTLEEAITYLQGDELLEVTPESIRLRKRLLDATSRKTAARRSKKVHS